MRVKLFDIEQGLYHTIVNGIESELHSHPAIEIALCANGHFSAQLGNIYYDKLTFVVIDANVPHSIVAKDTEVEILLVEFRDMYVKHALLQQGISITNGFFASKNSGYLNCIADFMAKPGKPFEAPYDIRVQKAISLINTRAVEYPHLMKMLLAEISLSESRLSHIFKAYIGVSIKKYYVWAKLKRAVQEHIINNDRLIDAVLDNGFYDQPHFNKSYKGMIGVSPGKVYNSRIIQG